MSTETILKPIGKGQITPPKAWREALGIEGKPVKATFTGSSIIIEPLEQDNKSWDIDRIKIQDLDEETIETIRSGEQAYVQGESDKFISSNDFWYGI